MDNTASYEVIPFDFTELKKSYRIKSIQGLKWIEDSFVTVFDTLKETIICIKKDQGKFECIFSAVKKPRDVWSLTSPGGLARIDDHNYLVADRNKKIIYTADIKSSKLEPYVNLIALKKNGASEILNSQMSVINDIEYHDNKVWFVCKAGYSSSICCFDTQTNELSFKFFARGSEPRSMSSDCQGKDIWILDSLKKEISRFGLNGEYKEFYTFNNNKLSDPVGLAIDNSGNLWVANQINPKEGTVNDSKRK